LGGRGYGKNSTRHASRHQFYLRRNAPWIEGGKNERETKIIIKEKGDFTICDEYFMFYKKQLGRRSLAEKSTDIKK